MSEPLAPSEETPSDDAMTPNEMRRRWPKNVEYIEEQAVLYADMRRQSATSRLTWEEARGEIEKGRAVVVQGTYPAQPAPSEGLREAAQRFAEHVSAIACDTEITHDLAKVCPDPTHNHPASLAQQPAPSEGLGEALDAVVESMTWDGSTGTLTDPEAWRTLVGRIVMSGQAALTAPVGGTTVGVTGHATERRQPAPSEGLHPCWFCKGEFVIEALIAGYDTFDEQRLACLACNERMSGNWRPIPSAPSEELTYEGQVREHFEPQRHFFEPPDGDGPCSTCGEDRDHDFIRVTVHYNDGDG